jgi:hypothetical protein
LNEEPTQVEGSFLKPEQDAVLALWHAVFPGEGKSQQGA